MLSLSHALQVKDYMNGGLKVDEFVTSEYKLDDIMKAFESMHNGLAIRPVVIMKAEK